MGDVRNYYVFCDDKCLFEGMTKEQILAAIEQAVSTGEIKDVDTGFVTKIKEQNKGTALTFWVGTTAQYNAIEQKAENCFYIVTDDNRIADIDAAIKDINDSIKEINENNAKRGKTLYSGEWGGDYSMIVDGLGDYTTFIINGVLCSRKGGGIFGTSKRCEWLHTDVYAVTEYTITIPSSTGDTLNENVNAGETQITYTISLSAGVKAITDITRRAIEEIVGLN